MKIEEFIEVDKETGTQTYFIAGILFIYSFFWGPYQEIYLIFKTPWVTGLCGCL